MKWKLDKGKQFLLIESWVDEKDVSLTELEAECMHASKDFLFSMLCCVDENNHTFNEIEAGYKISYCYVHADENKASFNEIEAGMMKKFLPNSTVSPPLDCPRTWPWNEKGSLAVADLI